jgi:glycosyltransferase involved in cell wall biosynthesis
MKISVITPSFNQGLFIERTINSVLNQSGNFELEYIVIDGGSTDSTLDIIKKFGSRLRWISEPDKGQSDAINKGMRIATGDILAWLNSDDTYEPQALVRVCKAFRDHACEWCFGVCRIISEDGNEIRRFISRYKIRQSKHYSYNRLLRRAFISQPATFFSRKAYTETGEIDTRLSYSMDYDYWLRLGLRYDPLFVDFHLANYRWYKGSKNGSHHRRAAWETFLTAKRHAPRNSAIDIAWHFLQYIAVTLLYKVI